MILKTIYFLNSRHMVRKEVEKENKAAAKIQAVYKGHAVRARSKDVRSIYCFLVNLLRR